MLEACKLGNNRATNEVQDSSNSVVWKFIQKRETLVATTSSNSDKLVGKASAVSAKELTNLIK